MNQCEEVYGGGRGLTDSNNYRQKRSIEAQRSGVGNLQATSVCSFFATMLSKSCGLAKSHATTGARTAPVQRRCRNEFIMNLSRARTQFDPQVGWQH